MKSRKMIKALILAGIVFIGFTQCTKKNGDSVKDVTSAAPAIVDTPIDASWTLDQVHTGFLWRCQFMDLTNTFLTGKFNNYGFNPAFTFDPNNMSAASIHFWVDLSTFNTGQPGRDGKGKCGMSYVGITYKDSAKTIIDSASIWAKYDATSVIKSGSGYVATGTLSINRYRAVSGNPDGTPVSRTCTLYFTYNEFKDMGGTPDQHRIGLSGHLMFDRREFVDSNSTVQWVPTPTVGTTNLSTADKNGDITAANNTMYGVYMTEVGDSCWVDVNPVFYKNY